MRRPRHQFSSTSTILWIVLAVAALAIALQVLIFVSLTNLPILPPG
jgi:hypothetical protein